MKNIRFIAIIVTTLLVTTLCIPIFMLHVAGEENIVTVTFDLANGNVSITDAGYIGVDESGNVISGAEETGKSYKYIIKQSNSSTATNYVVSVGTPQKGVKKNYELHFKGVNIDAPQTPGVPADVTVDNVKTVKIHAPAIYVNNQLDSTVYLVFDDNTTNTLKAYAKIFPEGTQNAGKHGQLCNPDLLPESERFGHAAIEKEVGPYNKASDPTAQGTLVVTCEEGLKNYEENYSLLSLKKGHNCAVTDPCGVLNATAYGEAGFQDDADGTATSNTRTAAGAAIGSKAEVSKAAEDRTALKGAPTMGSLYNLIIAGGKITATGALGNWNYTNKKNVYLGGSPGIGVGSGLQQHSKGYELRYLRITGGLINAIAGDGSSANIGGGYHAGYIRAYIYGGHINATQKLTNNDDMKRGAGIGGGGGGSSSNATAGATVVIRGGEIEAYSSYGAAIGSGGGGSNGSAQSATIEISGGSIEATTSGDGAGAAIGTGGSLGTGEGGSATVTISGGYITASSSNGADIGGGGTNSAETSGAGGAANITISGDAIINSQKGGIGGGNANKGTGGEATVTINGGTINATSIGGGNSKGTEAGGAATVVLEEKDGNKIRVLLTGTIGGGNCTSSGNGGKAKVTVKSGYLECGDIGGGNSKNGNGGAAEIIVSGGILKAKSIGGGSTQEEEKSIGYATANISGGEITGQFIMAAGGTDDCSFVMTGGRLFGVDATTGDYTKKDGGAIYMDDPNGVVNISGGTIENCKAENGGAIYMTAGTVTISGTATLQNCSATEKGGAVYMGGGTLTMSGGTLSSNQALNGAGAFVANGNVTVEGGTITQNKATENGGAFYISNGNYIMVGGELSHNQAITGDGGAIYISSSQNNTDVTVRSGSIINNAAGNSGGALGVYGQNGITFTITIGSNTDHSGRVDCHAMVEGDGDEACPIIKNNTSQISGGGIYLAGSYDAVMNMYCLKEEGNKVGAGHTKSDFMMIDGGTLNINSQSQNGEGEILEDYGNIIINSSIHVVKGKVTLMGTTDNPMFKEAVTIDIDPALDSFFHDYRKGSDARTIQYYENLNDSGRYVTFDVFGSADHIIQPNMYTNPGYAMNGWRYMTVDSEGNYIPTDSIFQAGMTAYEKDYPGNLIFFAVWEEVKYTLIFSPGVNSYGGEMEPMSFEYGQTQKLSLNKFTCYGFCFGGWLFEGSEAPLYLDGDNFTWPETEKTTLVLTVFWVICDHTTNLSKFTVNKTANSISRTCHCQAYTETIVMQGINTVYTGEEHPAKFTYSAISNNEKPAPEAWKNTYLLLYNGISNGDIKLENSITAPINACEDKGAYTASITVEHNGKEITISAPIMIVRAERTEIPDEPQYSQSGNVITVENPNDPRQFVLAYQFSWYLEDTLVKSDWISWDPTKDPLDPLPSKTMDETWSNYSVDVRYAQTENYKASQIRQGTKSFVWTGEVTIIIKCAPSSGLAYSRVDPDEENRAGITVTLIPIDNTYYVYNAEADISIAPNIAGTDISAFEKPKIDNISVSSDSWVVWVHNIANAETLNIDGGVTIEIVFKGGEKKVIVSSSATKNEVFDNIAENGEGDVTVSRDSSYTVNFDVEYFKHYSNPAVEFGEILPKGTTIIMKDFSNSTYWSYTVTGDEGIKSLPLSSFVRMGTKDQTFAIGEREVFTLQFAIDFSNCETTMSADTLTTAFVATSVGVTTPPIADALCEIGLVSEPTFRIEESVAPTQTGLSQSVLYHFAYNEESVGVSKWDNACGILVVTPNDLTALPPDARLRVKIGNNTDTYSLINGKFMVILPSIGRGTATLNLLSDMLPKQGGNLGFDVQLYASATKVKTTPTNKELSAKISIAYTLPEVVKPAIHTAIVGDLPEYKGMDESGQAIFTSLAFTVKVGEDMPDDGRVRAMLYAKNANGGYTSTTQEGKLTQAGSFYYRGEIGFESFAQEMKATGSLSLMLSIEILDKNDKVINSVPLYFILIDTRQ